MSLKFIGAAVCAVFLLHSGSGLASGPLGEYAAEKNKPLIADFGLNICKQCIKQSEAMEEYRLAVGDGVETRFVHVTKEAQTAGEYKVMLIPTLIFFDRSGKEVFRQVGYMPADEMISKSRSLGFLPK